MFNHSLFNQTKFNVAAAGAEKDPIVRINATAASTAEAAFSAIRTMSAAAEALSEAAASTIVEHIMAAVASAVTAAEAQFIRAREMTASAEAESTVNRPSLYGVNTEVIGFTGLTLSAGDELIIDTDNMTVTINGENAIMYLADSSTFFTLSAADIIRYEGTGTADIRLLWKDRWY